MKTQHKTTKKEIIKKMLIDELRSPEMAERLRENPDLKIKIDLINDDELIAFAESMKHMVCGDDGCVRKYVADDGRVIYHNQPLTPRAYLLLAAYKHSLSRLCEYERHHRRVYEGALYEAARRNSWRLEYEKLCNGLYNKILARYHIENNH